MINDIEFGPSYSSKLDLAAFTIFVLPFIVGFVLSLAISLFVFSWKNKTNRLYIKSLALRLLASFIISVIGGSIGVILILILHSYGIDIVH